MQEAIRDAIVTHLSADYLVAYPSLPIAYPNAPFDWGQLPEQFVEVDIEFQGGGQVGMAAVPKRRVSGHVYVSVHRRIGTGTKAALGVIDWFSNKLKFAHVGAVQLEAPEPDGNEKLKGFHIEHLKVCFYSDPG